MPVSSCFIIVVGVHISQTDICVQGMTDLLTSIKPKLGLLALAFLGGQYRDEGLYNENIIISGVHFHRSLPQPLVKTPS